MPYKSAFERWKNSSHLSEDEKNELESLSKNEKELAYRFSQMLSFGTAGLRGTMSPGLNGMNRFTVRYATQGLANRIIKEGAEAKRRGVVIGFDSRHNSQSYAKEAACVLAANDIHVFLFDSLCPTPEVSFAIRDNNAIAGINITASHNPKEYNGYKIYWEDGAQMSPENANEISRILLTIDIFDDVKVMDLGVAKANGLITSLGDKTRDAYLSAVFSERIYDLTQTEAGGLKVVFSPLHGAGFERVPQILSKMGIPKVFTVDEQMILDGDFPSVPSPNPEDARTFERSLALSKEIGADIIILTDPDCDRIAAAAKDQKGEYILFTGNQMAILLLSYILEGLKEQGRLDTQKGVMVQTIVSTRMTLKIAKEFGLKTKEVLTGFKFIGEQIKEMEKLQSGNFIFGFEESLGYLKGTYCREKDAVLSAMLFSELACRLKADGLTMPQYLERLYKTYGYFGEKIFSIYYDGMEANEKMTAVMKNLRKNPPTKIAEYKITGIKDYLENVCYENGIKTGETDLPTSDVLSFSLETGDMILIRPSGTEPKVKCYIMVSGETSLEQEGKIARLEPAMRALIG